MIVTRDENLRWILIMMKVVQLITMKCYPNTDCFIPECGMCSHRYCSSSRTSECNVPKLERLRRPSFTQSKSFSATTGIFLLCVGKGQVTLVNLLLHLVMHWESDLEKLGHVETLNSITLAPMVAWCIAFANQQMVFTVVRSCKTEHFILYAKRLITFFFNIFMWKLDFL